MTAPSDPTPCPACGTPCSGKFCPNCGISLTPRSCVRCQAALSPTARFCHRCGTPAPGGPRPRGREAVAWGVAAALALLLVGVVVWKVIGGVGMPARPDTGLATGGNSTGLSAGPGVPLGRAPDISRMTPEERFARLNDKVMQAAQDGDTSTVINFTPMALGAYAQLPAPNIDARYHAAILHAQIGDFAPALALADTIEREAPGNLFGYLIRGTVADFSGDAAGRRAAYTEFVRRFATEMKKARPEYTDHRALLEEFRATADSATRG